MLDTKTVNTKAVPGAAAAESRILALKQTIKTSNSPGTNIGLVLCEIALTLNRMSELYETELDAQGITTNPRA